ncbi:hypothetical protein ACET3Z_015183 [Daucus carota]
MTVPTCLTSSFLAVPVPPEEEKINQARRKLKYQKSSKERWEKFDGFLPDALWFSFIVAALVAGQSLRALVESKKKMPSGALLAKLAMRGHLDQLVRGFERMIALDDGADKAEELAIMRRELDEVKRQSVDKENLLTAEVEAIFQGYPLLLSFVPALLFRCSFGSLLLLCAIIHV